MSSFVMLKLISKVEMPTKSLCSSSVQGQLWAGYALRSYVCDKVKIIFKVDLLMASLYFPVVFKVNAKVEMLTMFGEKLQQAEGVANDLESKFEMKMKTVEAEHGRADILKANLKNTQVSLQDVTQKYNGELDCNQAPL